MNRGGRGGRGAAAVAVNPRRARGGARGGQDRSQATRGRGGHTTTAAAANESVVVREAQTGAGASDTGPVATNDDFAGFNGDASTNRKADNEQKKSSTIPQGSTKSWASILARAPVPPIPQPEPEPAIIESESPQTEDLQEEPVEDSGLQGLPAPPHETSPVSSVVPELASTIDISTDGKPVQGLPPPKTELTEDNLAMVPDSSTAAPTGTIASTLAASQTREMDQNSATPARALGGYAAAANRLTGTPGRGTNYRRPVLQQRESVIMPHNHAIDQTVVQFGSFGLSGDADGVEDVETRAQPPPHSPGTHPKMSLPADSQPPGPPPEMHSPVVDWSYTGPPGSSGMPSYPSATMSHMPPTSQSASYQHMASDPYGASAQLHQQQQQQQMHQQSMNQPAMNQPPMNQQSMSQPPVSQQSMNHQSMHQHSMQQHALPQPPAQQTSMGQQSMYHQPMHQQSMGSASGKASDSSSNYVFN